MKRRTTWLAILFIALLAIGSHFISNHVGVAYAQGPAPTIPRAWGTCKGWEGGEGNWLILEAVDGTIRLVNPRTGQAERIFTRR